MSEWRGFVIESKTWMSYPACGRWYFWRQFPRALTIFAWLTVRDAVLRRNAKLVNTWSSWWRA